MGVSLEKHSLTSSSGGLKCREKRVEVILLTRRLGLGTGFRAVHTKHVNRRDGTAFCEVLSLM